MKRSREDINFWSDSIFPMDMEISGYLASVGSSSHWAMTKVAIK
ncbi:MAG: hypothetical protein ACOH1R_03170 [Luteimonas sp.]